MVFYWSLSDSKSPQFSRTLLSILAVLSNVVVWMVSTRLPTSKSSSPFSNPLVTVPNAPFTSVILSPACSIAFQYPSKFEILILIFTFFQFYSVVSPDSNYYYSWSCIRLDDLLISNKLQNFNDNLQALSSHKLFHYPSSLY